MFLFQKDTPSGRMDQEAFLDTYKSLFDTGSADDYCKHVFRAFDKDKSGFIEFRVRNQSQDYNYREI